MIFIAGSLDLNGGSTFLIRIAKVYAERGAPVAVVVMNPVVDGDVKRELLSYANIYFISDFAPKFLSSLSGSQLGVFLPNSIHLVEAMIVKYGKNIHAMGIFGLIFAMKWARMIDGFVISTGVYHQNEFMFESRRFFSKLSQSLFKMLSPKSLIFFNEYNKLKYTQFFGVNYAESEILPIGIDVKQTGKVLAKLSRGRIVSVGNLVGFKTYNEHLIRVVYELQQDYPRLHYDIYGDGPNRAFLESLILSLELSDKITIHGAISYKSFLENIENSMLFIGSGTAIIESSSIALPSIVGIESIASAETYGFFYQIEGYTYNEYIEGRPLLNIKDIVVDLMTSSEQEWLEIGRKCQEKAREFSVETTVAGFDRVFEYIVPSKKKMSSLYEVSLFITFAWLCFLDAIAVDRGFRLRRNQSS